MTAKENAQAEPRSRTGATPARGAAPEADVHAGAPAPELLRRVRADGGALSPAQVLGLQRAMGNRATGRILAGTRAAPRGAVQRNMYLDNADDNIYKDSAGGDTEFAYITKGAIPYFIEYDRIDKLRANAALVGWSQTMNQRDFKNKLDEVAKLAEGGNLDAKSVITDLGEIRAVDTGKVVTVTENLKSFAYQMLVSQVLWAALSFGAQHWNTGGGSRLPRGQGTLYIRKELDPTAAVAKLGLQAGDLGGVTIKAATANILAALAGLRQEGQNVYAYKFDAKQSFPDAVYHSEVQARRSKNSRVTCAGKSYKDDFSDIGGDGGALATSWGKLAAPDSSDWISGKNLKTVDRGKGQAEAMEKWNALGAAAYANTFHAKTFPLDQNWEWLHVQGAQIGGETKGGNLVAGLFVTNSLMIPYESMIQKWAEAGATTFWARFTAERVGSAPFASKITFSIKAQGHPILGTLQFDPWMEFDPLHGRVVDKVAGEFIKRGLDQSSVVETFL